MLTRSSKFSAQTDYNACTILCNHLRKICSCCTTSRSLQAVSLATTHKKSRMIINTSSSILSLAHHFTLQYFFSKIKMSTQNISVHQSLNQQRSIFITTVSKSTISHTLSLFDYEVSKDHYLCYVSIHLSSLSIMFFILNSAATAASLCGLHTDASGFKPPFERLRDRSESTGGGGWKIQNLENTIVLATHPVSLL